MDPFEVLKQHLDITLLRTDLPDGTKGYWWPEFRVVMLATGLTQAEERCTLAHELVHAFRGDFHIDDPWLAKRQEQDCELAVARYLIPLDRLATELASRPDDYRLAEALNVDLETLSIRLGHLTPAEINSITGTLCLEETA